jgi:hypothetical protein
MGFTEWNSAIPSRDNKWRCPTMFYVWPTRRELCGHSMQCTCIIMCLLCVISTRAILLKGEDANSIRLWSKIMLVTYSTYSYPRVIASTYLYFCVFGGRFYTCNLAKKSSQFTLWCDHVHKQGNKKELK